MLRNSRVSRMAAGVYSIRHVYNRSHDYRVGKTIKIFRSDGLDQILFLYRRRRVQNSKPQTGPKILKKIRRDKKYLIEFDVNYFFNLSFFTLFLGY